MINNSFRNRRKIVMAERGTLLLLRRTDSFCNLDESVV